MIDNMHISVKSLFNHHENHPALHDCHSIYTSVPPSGRLVSQRPYLIVLDSGFGQHLQNVNSFAIPGRKRPQRSSLPLLCQELFLLRQTRARDRREALLRTPSSHCHVPFKCWQEAITSVQHEPDFHNLTEMDSLPATLVVRGVIENCNTING